VASQGQATPVGPDSASGGGKRTDVKQSTPSSSVGGPGGATGGKTGVRGCHDLRLAGETETRTYSLASGKELNEGGRDYNTRFCDMTTDGGGWTVRLSSRFQFLFFFFSKNNKNISGRNNRINETQPRVNQSQVLLLHQRRKRW
jgi:hypothetical protein